MRIGGVDIPFFDNQSFYQGFTLNPEGTQNSGTNFIKKFGSKGFRNDLEIKIKKFSKSLIKNNHHIYFKNIETYDECDYNDFVYLDNTSLNVEAYPYTILDKSDGKYYEMTPYKLLYKSIEENNYNEKTFSLNNNVYNTTIDIDPTKNYDLSAEFGKLASEVKITEQETHRITKDTFYASEFLETPIEQKSTSKISKDSITFDCFVENEYYLDNNGHKYLKVLDHNTANLSINKCDFKKSMFREIGKNRFSRISDLQNSDLFKNDENKYELLIEYFDTETSKHSIVEMTPTTIDDTVISAFKVQGQYFKSPSADDTSPYNHVLVWVRIDNTKFDGQMCLSSNFYYIFDDKETNDELLLKNVLFADNFEEI